MDSRAKTHRPRRWRRGPLTSLGLFIASWLLPSAVFGFGLGIHPTTIEVGLRPGDQHRQILTVGNIHREKKIALTVGIADWTLDEHQQLELSPPGTSARSAADWVRFSPAALELSPGESQRIVVEIDVPVGVSGPGDYRFAILVSPVLPPPEARRQAPSGVWSRVQVSSLFYVTVPPAKADAVVVDARLVRGAEGGPAVRFGVHNRGTSHSRLSGELRLLDSRGAVVLRQPISRVVLEGQIGQVLAPLDETWRDLPPGRYQVAFDLRDYEGQVPVRLAAPPSLELPWTMPPPEPVVEPAAEPAAGTARDPGGASDGAPPRDDPPAETLATEDPPGAR